MDTRKTGRERGGLTPNKETTSLSVEDAMPVMYKYGVTKSVVTPNS